MADCPACRYFGSNPKYADGHPFRLPWQTERRVWYTLLRHTTQHCLCQSGPLISAVVCRRKRPTHKECLLRWLWWGFFRQQKTWGWSSQAIVPLEIAHLLLSRWQRALLYNPWNRRLGLCHSCCPRQTPTLADQRLPMSFPLHATRPK